MACPPKSLIALPCTRIAASTATLVATLTPGAAGCLEGSALAVAVGAARAARSQPERSSDARSRNLPPLPIEAEAICSQPPAP
jgi:hypothetical protein